MTYPAPSPVYLGPAAHTSAGSNRPIKRIVIHSTVSPCERGGARNIAAYFRSQSAGGSAHYCLTPETRVLTESLRWVPLGSVREGDQLVGLDEHPAPPRPRYLRAAEVEVVKRREAECVEVEMADGRTVTCSLDHRWLRLATNGKRAGSWDWSAAEELFPGCVLAVPLTPWTQGDRDMAWLGGLIDGEGCYSDGNKSLVFSQREGRVLDRARDVLDEHGIPFTISNNGNDVKVIRLSGLQATLRVLGQGQPVRFMHRNIWAGKPLGSRTYPHSMEVVRVTPVGVREVVSIQTSTATFIAEGVVSHNCVDPGEVVQVVYDGVIAWHAPPNANSLGIELCDYPDAKTAARWADPNHQAMFARAARLTAQLCLAYGVRPWFVGRIGLRLGRTGVTTHNEVSQAFGQSSHWDPGAWPRRKFMRAVRREVKAIKKEKN